MEIDAKIYDLSRFGGILVSLIVLAAISTAGIGDVLASSLDECPEFKELEIFKIPGQSYSSQAVRADLGGVPVMIPAHFAENLEYNVDPNQKNQRLDRLSKINIFGFDVRFPDMSGKDGLENIKDYYNSDIFTTSWFRVSVESGDYYAGPESIDRLAKRSLMTMLDSKKFRPLISYEKLDAGEFGLSVYAPKGLNPETNTPYREHRHAQDVYIAWGNEGEAKAYIRCSNRNIASAQCTHHFNLEPRMHANITISYRREFLSQWLERQDKVTELIYGFSVNNYK